MKIFVTDEDSGTMVYCKYCGTLADTPSKCLIDLIIL